MQLLEKDELKLETLTKEEVINLFRKYHFFNMLKSTKFKSGNLFGLITKIFHLYLLWNSSKIYRENNKKYVNRLSKGFNQFQKLKKLKN